MPRIPLLNLPPELHLLIASLLPFPDVLRLRFTCRHFHQLIPPLSHPQLLEAETTDYAVIFLPTDLGMRDQNRLHYALLPRYRSRGRKRESDLTHNRLLCAMLLDYLNQYGNRKTASDLDRNVRGIALPDSSGILSLVADVYNKEGAEFLAKDIQGSAHQIRTAVQENGRIYQERGIGSYMLPCDELEKDRLDFLYTMVMKALRSDRLIHVLYPETGRFLDLGCGTGLWAIEMAKTYLSAYVLGVDVSAIQPDSPPSNCVFRVPFDYELPWLMGEGKWDVIHMRMGCGSVTNWPRQW